MLFDPSAALMVSIYCAGLGVESADLFASATSNREYLYITPLSLNKTQALLVVR